MRDIPVNLGGYKLTSAGEVIGRARLIPASAIAEYIALLEREADDFGTAS